MIEIYAGPKALKTIQEHGFKQNLFRHFLGASGGPKWFMLFGLDKYLFGEFFNEREQELNLIGSSAGAFRAACLAQNDPVSAITTLAYKYANTSYSAKPTAQEISNSAIDIVDTILTNERINQVIENKIIKAHFIVAKCKGLVASDNKVLQVAGLIKSLLLNKIDRKLLAKQYQRYIFKAPSSKLLINDPYQFENTYQNLTPDNIRAALLASGSIPMVMSGVKNISGTSAGTYRDGGIIDYHFDFSLTTGTTLKDSIEQNNAEQQSENLNENELILYPHFSHTVRAGWFDKNSSRKVIVKNYENTVLLAPSQQFINSLPYKKIPDRTDFANLDSSTRIKYWETVLEQTTQLADCFNEFVIKQDLESIKAFKA